MHGLPEHLKIPSIFMNWSNFEKEEFIYEFFFLFETPGQHEVEIG
jgi:hypothetical protein